MEEAMDVDSTENSQKNPKFQKENVYNKLLPYADELEVESAQLFLDIKTNLIKSVLAREMRPSCALWTSRLMKYIKIYGMKFSKEDHIALIKLFYELTIIPDLEPTRINKCATTLIQLLKKKYLLTRDDLQLEWRPLYDLCVKAMEKSKTEIGMYRYPSNFELTLFHLIRSCKVYFPASATQEILDEFRPKMCIFNHSEIANTIKFLEIFLPNSTKPEEADISYKLWFEELMNLWDTCQDDSSWENNIMWIMTGLARFQIGQIDWQPYIPKMFVRFQRTFQLPVAFKQRHQGRNHKMDISAIALWIVCILNGDKNDAFFHFEKFMQCLESYFYPANTGRWTTKLRELLRTLSFYMIQRVHCERYKTPSWEFHVPDHFKLTDADLDRFVNIMKPCIEQALYNRIGLQDTSLTLQYLSCLRPNIIIPMTLEKLYSSMNSLTEPHKLTSSMMAVIACGRYMVQGSRNNYPEGPTHIIPLLMELLPGIDPNDVRKSYVTFNFIVHFVNMIPLIDSSSASNYHDLTEEEHIVCEATANFEDFVLQFFDKLCVWMESNSLEFIRMEQITSNESARNRIETISESALGSVVGVVLNQCSPDIFKKGLHKIMKGTVVGEMYIPNNFCYFREWGKAQQIQDLKISWYVPETQEVAAVQNLLERYLLPELQRLEKISSAEESMTRLELKQSLKIVTSILSCQPLLPMWEEEVYPLVESVLEPWTFNLKVCGGGVVTMPDGSNVRKAIVAVLHKLQKALLDMDEGDTQSIQHIINIYNILLFNKTRGQDFEFHWKSFHMTKKLLEDRLLQKKLHLRHVLVDRVMLQQEFRIESRNCSFTGTHRMILLDLFELSTSRYSEVRIAAQNKLFSVVSYFPYSYSVLTEKIKDTLNMDSEKNHERFKGCLYILLGPKSAPIIARHDWKFIEQIWPLVVKSMPSEKPSIIALIMALNDTIDKCFPTIAINLVIPQSVLTAAYNFAKNQPVCDTDRLKALEANGEAYLKRKSEERRSAYDGTMNSLMDSLESGSLHWRYHQMAINFIKDLVHMDVKYTPRIVRFFLKSLIDDSLLVRKSSLKILVFILLQNKVKYTKTVVDPFSFSKQSVINRDVKPGVREDNKWLIYSDRNIPKNVEQWEERRYIHDQYTGYYCWPKTLELYDPPSTQKTAAKRLDDLTEIEKDVYTFFNNKENIEKLIKFLSLEEKKGRDHFNAYRFLAFKNLFKIFEDSLLPNFVPHLQRLVEDKLESSNRCAAEIISGIIRGSKHWEYNKIVNLWSTILPLLENAIFNLCSSTKSDWTINVGTVLDVYRISVPLTHLSYLQDPFRDPTILVTCTRLQLLFVALSQQSWRNHEISGRLLEYLRPHLTHPFKNIRERISSLLVIVFANSRHEVHAADGDEMTNVRNLFAYLQPKMKELLEISLAKMDDDKTDKDQEPNAKNEEKESLIRLYKIGLIQSIVLELLEDPQHEVRVQAAKDLSGLLHCQFIPDPTQLLTQFKQKARYKHKKKAVPSTSNNNNIKEKHAAVLGLCAFIESHPYDVPDYLPDIFEHLRPHLSDPQPIPATIRKTLGDFKRTHHNNWETHKLKFTEEELCLLSDLTVPPSYYV
uniref:Proteasome activator complex subunit 4B-like n=1 Tax=Diabrotica virgifera virgifera TaxID=50390 RepID=A0A6P7GVF6_DIAVI